MRPRTLVVMLLLASAALAMPAAAEHPEHHRCDDEVFFHLCVDVQILGPGESITRHLFSPEGDLREGWVYIIYGGVDGQGTVIADLVHDNQTVESFVWTPGFHKNSTRIQFTGPHDLVLRNPSNDTETKYAFYYDQSCNCAGKLIPLPGGFVLFNNKFPADRDVTVRFPMIDGWGLRAAAASSPATGPASWPDDYAVLTEATAQDKGWLELDFRTNEAGVYYIFLEALQGASPDAPIQLTPEWIVADEVDESPAVPLVAMVALLVILGLAWRGKGRAETGV